MAVADEPTGLYMTAPDGAHDEPTAIRHPDRGKAHRPVRVRMGWSVTTGDTRTPVAFCGFTGRDAERVPLSQTAPEDRCRTCWPTAKDVTP